MRLLISFTLAVGLVVGCMGGEPSAPRATPAGSAQQPVGSLAPAGSAQQPVGSVAPAGTGMAGGVCYLVTDAEIGSIMGRQPIGGGGSGFEMGGLRFCNWILYADPVEGVNIQLSRAANHEEGRMFDHESVPGLGEDAYWVTTENLESLHVRQGQYSLNVGVVTESKDLKTAAIAVARAALSRLP